MRLARRLDVCFWHQTDMPAGFCEVRSRGVKRKSHFRAETSAFDPERPFGPPKRHCGLDLN